MHPFWTWWQSLPSQISPYIATIGPVRLHWYGFMYVVAFAVGYGLAYWRIKKGEVALTVKQLQDYLFWAALGVVIGGRLGYALFYAPGYFFAHPLEIILPFRLAGGAAEFTGLAGMSFHGGLIGIAAATIWFAKSRDLRVWDIITALVPVAPAAFFFGRIGNFINGELWGRPTDMPWGMSFPRSGTTVLRHPSQLYEAALEGALLFAILWPLRNHPRVRPHLLALYLIGYALMRFLVEFFREPDAHLGAVAGPFSMGQVLSLLMLISGIMVWKRHNLRSMFWDKWFKKDKKEEKSEETPAGAEEKKADAAHSPDDHNDEEEKKICEFC